MPATTFTDILKFNPYHDSKGRFASADAATSFTYAPGKSTAHDAAIQRAKDAHAAETGKGFKGTLYHGSPAKDIEEFDMSRAGANTSSGEKLLFFTDSKQLAEDFSYERLEGSTKYFQRRGEKGRVYEVDVEIKNPLDFRHLSDKDIDNILKLDIEGVLTREDVKSLSGNHQLLKTNLDLRAESLKKLGYDGLIANTGKAGHYALEYAVVDSKQATIRKGVLMKAMTFYDILKGNPYHDERGRFTTAPNARHPMIRTDPPPKKTKVAYKVFVARDGKLYPPMVANPGAMDTPVGVWLDAAEGTLATDKDGNPITNTLGRNKVKAGGKGTQGGGGTLAYRPGWHLGELPEAKQFYTKDKVTGEKKQKKNFVWAECEIAADFNYQEEAMSYGYNKNGKFQHSLAGLPKIPKDGYYTYRTNPDPTTQPWYITGSMKVNRILTDRETNAILRSHGIEPMKRDGGELNLKALGFTETNFVGKSEDVGKDFSIFKTDDDKRLVFGWASISVTVDGEQLEDRQQDMIDPEDLEEAAYEYVLNFRDTGEEHIQTMRKKGKLVESCVFTAEKQKALGIPDGTLPIGWWIGFKIEDDAAWEKVKNGTYRMFSIEGKANRVPVEKAVETVENHNRVAKTFDEILKFNPYHDSRGRFASANGYASFTIQTRDPKKQYMADMAIAREKERAAAASPNPTNDPDTIAGVKRGQPMTHEQADEGRGNPNYDATNPDARPYRINCQTCVVAYEARLRGYDVEATGRNKTNQTQEELSRKCESAWIDPATGNAPTVLKNDPKIRTSKQAQKWLEENVEEGGRYQFAHGWKGTNGRSGHIVTVSRDSSGSLRIFDPQSGKNYSGSEVTEYMGRIKSTYSIQQYNPRKRSGMESIPQGRLQLLRVDNMQINADVANAVLKGANE